MLPVKKRKAALRRLTLQRCLKRYQAETVSGDIHQIFKLCCGRVLIDFLDSSKFTGQTLQRRLLHLPLGIGLLGLIGTAMQVTHHLGNRYRVARLDFCFIFLRTA